jgi:hypothetical protein
MILLGEGKRAWKLMLAYYDRKSDWGLDVCGKPLNANGACPRKTERLTHQRRLNACLMIMAIKSKNDDRQCFPASEPQSRLSRFGLYWRARSRDMVPRVL